MARRLYSYNRLNRYIGQTATIFTTSGGQSGRGFTGVVTSVNRNFARLITHIGTAPRCALGNSCDCEELVGGSKRNRSRRNRSRFQGLRLGSIVEVPTGRIAAFVHNAIGSGW